MSPRQRAAMALGQEAREIFGTDHDVLADVAGLKAALTESEINAVSRVMRAAFTAGVHAYDDPEEG